MHAKNLSAPVESCLDPSDRCRVFYEVGLAIPARDICEHRPQRRGGFSGKPSERYTSWTVWQVLNTGWIHQTVVEAIISRYSEGRRDFVKITRSFVVDESFLSSVSPSRRQPGVSLAANGSF